MKKLWMSLLLAAAVAGCSSEPQKPKTEGGDQKPRAQAPEAKNDYETGRAAFQKTFIAARGWAADARPYRIESQYTNDAPVGEGKAGVWRVLFASASKRAVKPFVWSGVASDDAPSPGINPGSEDDYSLTNPNTQPFDIGFLKQDSDKAFEVAQAHGGEKLLKKTPSQPVVFVTDWRPKQNQLVWRVLYGTSAGDAKLRVVVDATTGEFLKVER